MTEQNEPSGEHGAGLTKQGSGVGRTGGREGGRGERRGEEREEEKKEETNKKGRERREAGIVWLKRIILV